MAGILRRILPISSAKTREEDDEDYNVEYSFAVEYSGPPISYNIPKAAPVDVDQLPIASVVGSDSAVSNLSLPVIHPLSKKLSGEFKLGNRSADPLKSASDHSGDFLGTSTNELKCKSVNLKDFSVTCSTDVDEHVPTVSYEITSSGSLGFSEGHDDSHEISESSEVEDLNDDIGENLDVPEEELNSEGVPLEIYSCEEEDCIEEYPCGVNRASTVTLNDPESSAESVIIQRRLENRSNVKKGLCHRCLKRNRFSKKEVCIVCGAKYCVNCVLRAMGSMPEGRKCITCIGYPIDESNRETLGKPSKVLRQLLSDVEVKQIMLSEISCDANQLPPNLVYVNREPLCREEFILLQTCPNPPKRLKPGRYWYDKVSGFWGKEGQKPCQIISAQLDVGGEISRDASNGNTKIIINHREITKAEKRLMEWVGIRCEGFPNFWLGADGSLQEEGMNNVLPRVWDKTGLNLVCALLSLPIPPENANPSGEGVTYLKNGTLANCVEQELLYKLLLVGYDKTGTSTIFKQARMVHNICFTKDEREKIKLMIQSSLYGYLGILLEWREQFEEECNLEMREKHSDQPGPSGSSSQSEEKNVYSLSPRLKAFSDWLVQVMISGNLEVIFPAASREYAPLVQELLKDRAFQATYNRMNKLHMLPRVSKYFLDRAVEVSRTDYEPSDVDILYADGITSSNGLTSMEFSFNKPTQDSFIDPADLKHMWQRKYELIRVHSSSLGENCKWLQMFEDTDLVLFCVSLTDYDQFLEDENGVSSNKMLHSKKLFENIVTHPTFHHKNFLLILNKFDLLEEKIEQAPLNRCEWFDDFIPVISLNQKSTNGTYHNPSLAHRAFQYIGMKFKRLFQSLTGRKLYVSVVTALDPDTIDGALRYASEILKWDEEKPIFSAPESPSYTLEASSTS